MKIDMSLTPSAMLPLGTQAPLFNLPDPEGRLHSLDQLKSKQATVILFMCNHCPFVKHIMNKFVELAEQYHIQGVHFIAISSNDIESYPEDAPDKMALFAKMHNFSFPYLYDKTQATAKAYQAACTPDIYLFDKNLRLAYRGRFDGSSPGNNIPITGEDLAQALNAVLSNNLPSENQKPSIGCNIKWKKLI